MNKMNNVTDRNINVEPITGEVYYDYTEYSDKESNSENDSCFDCIESWLSNRVNNYFDRLSSLRVYNHK